MIITIIIKSSNEPPAMTAINQIGMELLDGVGVGVGDGDGDGDGSGLGGEGLEHVATQKPFAPEQQPESHCAPSVHCIPFA